MGRKSLEAQRKEEILAAFERCIRTYGLDASLEQIADEANVKRSLIRHYIGNRDVLVDELIVRITGEVLEQVRTMGDGIPDSELLGQTLDYLFRTDSAEDSTDRLLLQALMTAQNRYPLAKQSLQALFTEIVSLLAGDLMRLFPGRDATAYHETAYSILCLSFGNESMLRLGLSPAYNLAARQHAQQLIDRLKG
jgi:AcrR family transcriptional regulator